jgi:hypothetical protein
MLFLVLVFIFVKGLVVERSALALTLTLTCRDAPLQSGPFVERRTLVFALGRARHRDRRLRLGPAGFIVITNRLWWLAHAAST